MIRRSGAKNRSTAGVLADIASELSAVTDWKTRVQYALSMLCDIIPTQTAALGIQLNEWLTFYCPTMEDHSSLDEILLEHYTVLTGKMPGSAGNGVPFDQAGVGVIVESEDDTGSFLSLPVIGAGQVIGVLHVFVDEEDVYTPDDVSLLSIIALQIGSYVKNVQAQMEAQMRAKELENLRDEAEHHRSELESFITSTTDGVLLFDTECNTLMVNEAGKAMLGYPTDGTLYDWASKMRFYDMGGYPVSLEEYAPVRALHGEAVKNARYKLVNYQKREISLDISSSPVRNSAGKIVGVVNIFRDVSEEMEFQQRKQELFDREHHIAQMLQQALIPPQVEYYIDGVTIAVKYQSAWKEAEVGGDFYDIFNLENGKIGILIGDVAGKGLHAAIQVAAVRYAVRSYASLDPSPGLVMTLVNELLCKDEPNRGSFLTAVYAVIDTSSCTLTYASGGHEPPVIRKNDGQIEELTQGGRAIGVYGGFTYAEESRKMNYGETLLMVTDGISEARSNNILFGQEGVNDYLKSHGELSPSQIASGLLDAAIAHAGGALQDDAAIVVVALHEPAVESSGE